MDLNILARPESMQGNMFEVGFQILVGTGLLGVCGALPGLALIRILDPSADTFRKILLTPSFGLLILFGIAGWSVIIFGLFTPILLILGIAIANILAFFILRQRDPVGVKELSPWERMELALDINEKTIEKTKIQLEEWELDEANVQSEFQKQRGRNLAFISIVAIIISLLPLFLFRYPHGVDWIGFATLSHRFTIVGELSLPNPTVGTWTYPPAFPALAAWLEQIFGWEPHDCIHSIAGAGGRGHRRSLGDWPSGC